MGNNQAVWLFLMINCIGHHCQGASPYGWDRYDAYDTISSHRSRIVDEILSRPVMPLPTGIHFEEVDEELHTFSAQSQSDDLMKSSIEAKESSQAPHDDYENVENLFPTESAEEDAEANSVEGIPVELYIDSKRQSCFQDPTIRRLFDKAWQDRNLSFDMDAHDLALGVTKLKIDLLEYDLNTAIGIIASKMVKEHKDAKYRVEFRFWIMKYNSALRFLSANLNDKDCLRGEPISLEDRKRKLLTRVSKSQTRTYDDWNVGGRPMYKTELDANTRAKKTGERFLTFIRGTLGTPDLLMTDLSMADIAFHYRYFVANNKILSKAERVSRESIKRYMKKYLHKSNEEVDEFSVQCLNYKRQLIQEGRQACSRLAAEEGSQKNL